jgi:hypothetical protein
MMEDSNPLMTQSFQRESWRANEQSLDHPMSIASAFRGKALWPSMSLEMVDYKN